jgi:hypothetical protein
VVWSTTSDIFGVDGDVFDPFRVRFSLLRLLRGLREALAPGYQISRFQRFV